MLKSTVIRNLAIIILWVLTIGSSYGKTVMDDIGHWRTTLNEKIDNASPQLVFNYNYYGQVVANAISLYHLSALRYTDKEVSDLKFKQATQHNAVWEQLSPLLTKDGPFTKNDIAQLRQMTAYLDMEKKVPTISLDNINFFMEKEGEAAIDILLLGKDLNSSAQLLGHQGETVAHKPMDASKKRLYFKISKDELLSRAEDVSGGVLKVAKGYMLEFVVELKKEKIEVSLPLRMVFVPRVLGTFKYTTTTKEDTRESKKEETGIKVQFAGDSDIEKKYCVPDHKGWTVVPSSVKLVVDKSSGEKDKAWTYLKSSNGKCYTVSTYSNQAGLGGKLTFHIAYTITRGSSSKKSTEEKELVWGEQLGFSTDKQWAGSFVSKDGKEYNLSEVHPYVVSTENNGELIISTLDMKSLIDN